MPDIETLDNISLLVGNISFKQITNPEIRLKIVTLAIQAENSDILGEIRNHLEDLAHYFNKSDYIRE